MVLIRNWRAFAAGSFNKFRTLAYSLHNIEKAADLELFDVQFFHLSQISSPCRTNAFLEMNLFSFYERINGFIKIILEKAAGMRIAVRTRINREITFRAERYKTTKILYRLYYITLNTM